MRKSPSKDEGQEPADAPGNRATLNPPAPSTPPRPPHASVNGRSLASHRSSPTKSRSRSHSRGSGPRGSLNWQLTCAAPPGTASPPTAFLYASQIAVAATRAGAPSPGGLRSTKCVANPPNIFTWSIVWFAPVPRSSCGRSAVRMIRGVPLSLASTAAGTRFAVAVPLLVMTAAGRPEPFPTPSA